MGAQFLTLSPVETSLKSLNFSLFVVVNPKVWGWMLFTLNKEIRMTFYLLQTSAARGLSGNQFLLSFKLSELGICEVLLVSWLSLERQRVEWVLGVLLMKDVLFAVVPVGESCLVWRHLNNRLAVVSEFLVLWVLRQSFFSLVNGLVCGCEVHLVGVDYFGLFLKVESILMILNFSLFDLAVVVLSVVWEKNLGIRVLNKPVGTSCVTNTFITDGKLLN